MGDFEEKIGEERFLTFGTNYLLVELSFVLVTLTNIS